MSKVDWSLAPEGATHWVGGNWPWHKHDGDDAYYWRSKGGWELLQCADVKRVEYEYANSIIERPTPQSWPGEKDGLPPIGVTCERRFPEVEGSSWRPITICFIGEQKIFYRDEAGDEWANLPDDVEFRPIRTPEQLAAESRESAIREVMDIAQVDCRVTASRLVDAGFKREGK